MIHQYLHRAHPHWPYQPRSRILRRNCDRWHVIVCVPIPNTSIDCSSQPTEEGSTGNSLLDRSLRTGALMDPQNAELESPAVLLSPILADNDPAREHTGSVAEP